MGMQIKTGTVVSLDRGYPLVRLDAMSSLCGTALRQGSAANKTLGRNTGPAPLQNSEFAGGSETSPASEIRAQHSIDLVKNVPLRAAVGDVVDLEYEPGQDTPYISKIHDRTSMLIRRQMVESLHEGSGKAAEQVLAANFDTVYIVQSLGKRALDLDYLERQLVMANQSGVEVAVILTKLDIAKHSQQDIAAAQEIAPGCKVIALSLKEDTKAPERSLSLQNLGVGVLLGRSGVGKSTLINKLLGENRLETGSVRQKDSAGRHTTVARKMVQLPTGSALIDTPGLRSIGVYGAELGLATTFAEITAAAANCRYRDCTHSHEPGCAVISAVSAGQITARRLANYQVLYQEVFD